MCYMLLIPFEHRLCGVKMILLVRLAFLDTTTTTTNTILPTMQAFYPQFVSLPFLSSLSLSLSLSIYPATSLARFPSCLLGYLCPSCVPMYNHAMYIRLKLSFRSLSRPGLRMDISDPTRKRVSSHFIANAI
jgi:hypothetical protein